MRRAYLLAFVIAAMLLSAAPLAAQCQMQFNISFYIDGSVSDDLSTVYGYGNYVDNSTLCGCTHSDYGALFRYTHRTDRQSRTTNRVPSRARPWPQMATWGRTRWWT